MVKEKEGTGKMQKWKRGARNRRKRREEIMREDGWGKEIKRIWRRKRTMSGRRNNASKGGEME